MDMVKFTHVTPLEEYTVKVDGADLNHVLEVLRRFLIDIGFDEDEIDEVLKLKDDEDDPDGLPIPLQLAA